MTYTKEKLEELNGFIQNAKSIVITAHKSPDGDSIGSSIALYFYLKKIVKGSVSICHPDQSPTFLNWLEGSDDILSFENNAEEVKAKMNQADVIFCLDYNSFGRVGNEMNPVLANSSAKKIMIDHHLNPDDVFDISFSETTSCSTAQLIYDLIDANADTDCIDNNIGEAIYVGIMTDTGSFRFPSTSPHTHRVIANLLEKGISNNKVHESVFDNNSVNRLKLHGYAISSNLEILDEYKTAIISLSAEEQERFKAIKGDTEGLVNTVLSIKGITKAVFLKESDGIIKISFRSIGEDNPVNELASTYFEGGGHKNASGGRYMKGLTGAINKLKKVLPEFC